MKFNLTRIPGFGGNAIWSALDAAAAPMSGLLMAAGLVRILGTQEYGVIVMALAVSNLSLAVSPAISATTIRFVAAAASDRTSAKLAHVMTASLLVIMAIDLFLLLVATCFNSALAGAIFGTRVSGSEPQLGAILLLAVGAVCIQQIDGVCAAVLKGLEQFKRQSLVEVLSRATLVVSTVAAASLSHDVRVVLTVYCAVCMLFVAVRLVALRLTVGKARLFGLPARSDLTRLLHFGGWMWLNAAATVAFGTVDRIAVGRVSGPAVAAEYNIYMQLTQLIHFIPASLFAFSFPMFSRLGADQQANMPTIRTLYHRYFKAAAIIGASLGLLLLIFKPVILSAFGKSIAHEPHDAAFAVLVVSFVMLSFMILPYWLGLGLDRARSVSLITSTSMFVAVVLTVLLTPSLGIEGAVIGKLIYALGALALVFQASRILRKP